jgi:hypothetical protein
MQATDPEDPVHWWLFQRAWLDAIGMYVVEKEGVMGTPSCLHSSLHSAPRSRVLRMRNGTGGLAAV